MGLSMSSGSNLVSTINNSLSNIGSSLFSTSNQMESVGECLAMFFYPKGTIVVMSSYLSFLEGHVRFTEVILEPLS